MVPTGASWIAAAALGLAGLPVAPALAAGSAEPPPAASNQPGRFTVTFVSPDGRRETISVTAAELAAMSGGSPAAPPRRDPAPAPVAVAERPPPAQTPTGALDPRWTLQGGAPVRTAAATVATPAASAAAFRAEPVRVKPGDRPGVRDGKSFGDKGRFYLYAGGKDKAVGFNITDHGQEGWGGEGLSYDQGGVPGQRAAGVGWRKGEVSTSLGWVHDKTGVKNLYGAPTEKDDRLALTVAWRPQPR